MNICLPPQQQTLAWLFFDDLLERLDLLEWLDLLDLLDPDLEDFFFPPAKTSVFTT